MVYHSSYAEKDLSECIDDLKEMLWNAQNGVGKTSKLTAVRRKFEKEKFMAVSTHPLVLDDNL
jgi:cyclin B